MGDTIISTLKRQRSDLSKIHAFDFWFYFRSEEMAEKAAVCLRDAGYQTKVRLAVDEKNWLCLGSKELLPVADLLNSIGSECMDLAEKYSGEFDGWECAIEKKPFWKFW